MTNYSFVPWTEGEDLALIIAVARGATVDQIKEMFTVERSKEEIEERIKKLTPPKAGRVVIPRRSRVGMRIKRFTPEEDQILIDGYNNYVPVDKIARQLGRSYGVVRQRALRLQREGKCPHRDGMLTRLVNQHGSEILAIGSDSRTIRNYLSQQEAVEKKLKAQELESYIKRVLAEADRAIWNKTMTREEAWRMCREKGLTLESIGSHFGLTRERIRQVTGNYSYASKRLVELGIL